MDTSSPERARHMLIVSTAPCEVTMRNPAVSVVTTAYNSSKYLPQAIESILAQTFGDLEYIVVDDGSSDGTSNIIREYARLDSRVTPITTDRRGIAGAANRGCDAARATYIARLDSDDIATPNRIELQVKYMEAHANIAVLGGAIQPIATNGRALGTRHFVTDSRDVKEGLDYGNCICHSTTLIRTAVLKGLGGYRFAFEPAEDYDLWLRVGDGAQLANLSDVIAKYRVHTDQASLCHLEQQAVSALGARISSQFRRSYGCDPFSGAGKLMTKQMLYALGVVDRAIDLEIWEHYNRAVNIMLEMSDIEPNTDAVLKHLVANRARYAYMNC
jgi:glycosyltransferase involved in cell wall biosynthesis